MRVIVTGAAGLLGSWWAEALLNRSHEVYGIDNLISGDRENIDHRLVWHEEDCGNHAAVLHFLKLIRPDVLVHCAALPYEGLSAFSPSLIFSNVAGASVSMFSAAIAAGVKKIVFCSSMARYGNQQPVSPTGFSEHQMPWPVDPYGIAKVAAEDALRVLCQVHRVHWTIVVPHNIYGPRQRYYDPFRNVVGIFLNAMLQGIRPHIYGKAPSYRCFSYVEDLVPALVLLVESSVINDEVINIGPEHEVVSIADLWDRCARVTGFSGEPVWLPARPLEVSVANCSCQKARQYLNWYPKTPLDLGLEQYAAWIKERGPRQFEYHLPVEIPSNQMPTPWATQWGSTHAAVSSSAS